MHSGEHIIVITISLASSVDGHHDNIDVSRKLLAYSLNNFHNKYNLLNMSETLIKYSSPV